MGLLSDFVSCIDIHKDAFLWSVGIIIFNPLMWNIVARTEYKTRFMSSALGKRNGCYLLALIIFTLGLYRDHIYGLALEEQKQWEILESPYIAPFVQSLAIALFGLGTLLVMATYYQLGITGVYLGDYFGILMKKKVTGFPFTILDNPMYMGSTMCFFAGALWMNSPAGIALSFLVYIVYMIAIQFEGPFTNFIYQQAGKQKIQKIKDSINQ